MASLTPEEISSFFITEKKPTTITPTINLPEIKYDPSSLQLLENRPLLNENEDKYDRSKSAVYLSLEDIANTPPEIVKDVSSYFNLPDSVVARDNGRLARSYIANTSTPKDIHPEVAAHLTERQIETVHLRNGSLPKISEFKRFWGDAATRIKVARANLDVGQFYFDSMIRGDGITPEVQSKIDAYKRYIERQPTDTDEFSFLPSTVQSLGEQVPMYGHVIGRGSVGASIIGSIGLAAGVVVSPFTGGTSIPAGAVGGLELGASIGGSYGMYEVTTGEALSQLMSVKGDNGETLNPEFVKYTAMLVGGVNAGLERLPLSHVAKWSGVSKAFEDLVNKNPQLKEMVGGGLLNAALKNPTFKKALFDASKNYATHIGEEGATEALQSIILDLAQNFLATDQSMAVPYSQVMQHASESFAAGASVAGLSSSMFYGRDIKQAIRNNKNDKDKLSGMRTFLGDEKISKTGNESQKNLVDLLTKNELVHVDGNAVLSFYQSLTDDQIKQMQVGIPDIDERLSDSAESGGKVSFSAGEYAAYIQKLDPQGTLDAYASFDQNAPTSNDINRLIEATKSVEDQSIVDPEEFLKQFPELDGMFESITQNDDRVSYDLLKEKILEASNVRGVQFTNSQASVYTNFVRSIVDTAKERSGRDGISENDRQTILNLASNLFLEMDVRSNYGELQKVWATNIDDLIDKAKRQTQAAIKKIEKPTDPDFFTKKRSGKTRKYNPKHVLKNVVGVVRNGSAAAQELIDIGITPKKYPSLFSDTEGRTGIDNIDIDHAKQSLHGYGIFPYSEDDTYVSAVWLREQLDNEHRGLGVKSTEEIQKEQEQENIDQFVHFISRAGLDIEKSSRAEIKAFIEHELKAGEGIDVDGETLFQGKQGSVTFTSDGRTIVEFMKDANLSTFIHEVGGHIGLNFLRNAANSTEIEHYKDTWSTIVKWWNDESKALYKEAKKHSPYKILHKSKAYFSIIFNGKEVGVASTMKEAKEKSKALHDNLIQELDRRGGERYVQEFDKNSTWGQVDEIGAMILTAQDEFFARGMEAYTLEGNAPSFDLRRAFSVMSRWMVRIYGTIRGLNVPINDDIRAVYDRLLATDAEIEALKTSDAFKPNPRIMEMLNKDQRERYVRLVEDQTRKARENVLVELTKEKKREKELWWQEKRKEIEESIGRHLPPAATAAYFLQTGKSPNGSDFNHAPFKLSKSDVDTRFDKIGLDSRMLSDDGVSVAEAAIIFGFDNDVAFIKELKKSGNVSGNIDTRIDQVMKKLYGDKMDNIAEMVVRDIIESDYENVIMQELKATGFDGDEFIYKNNVKLAAVHKVRQMPIRVAMRTGRYFTALQTNAREAGKALAKKDFAGFSVAKRKQLFSAYVFKEGENFKKYYENANRLYSRLMKNPKKGKVLIDYEYHSVIRDILGKYTGKSLGITPIALLEKIHSFVANDLSDLSVWVTEDGGLRGSLNSAISKTSMQDLTVEEFATLNNFIKNIAVSGIRKNEITAERENIDFQTRKAELLEQAEKVTKPRDKGKGLGEKVGSSLFAMQTQAITFLNILDGGKSDGVWHNTIFRPIIMAGRHAREMNSEFSKNFTDIMKKYYGILESTKISGGMFSPETQERIEKISFGLIPQNRIYIESIGEFVTKENIISMLLNWGNEGNREHLRKSGLFGSKVNKLTDEQVLDILGNLDEKDIAFAEDVWDLLDKLRPKMREVELKYKGFVSKDVEKTPFSLTLKNGKVLSVKGGYYPISFDPKSVRRTKKESILEKQYQNSPSASVRQQFTNDRVGVDPKDGRPINLRFSVFTRHLHDAIHYISMIDAISSTEKSLKDSRIRQAIQDRVGSTGLEHLDLWLKDVATGTISASDGLSSVHNFVRSNMIVSTMGLSVSTSSSQISGAILAIPELGGGVKGVKALLGGYSAQLKALFSGNYSNLLEEIQSSDLFMKQRHDTYTREIRENDEFWKPLPSQLRTKAIKAFMAPIFFVQMHAVDYAVWIAAKKQFLENNPDASESDANYHAANVVTRTQSSAEQASLSGILRGTISKGTVQGAFVKTMTFAFSYFNNKFNRVSEKIQGTQWIGGDNSAKLTAIRDIAFYIWADAFITDLILNRLPDMMPDDASDDDWSDVLSDWAWWFAVRPFEMMVLGREAVSALSGYDVDTPLYKAYDQINNMITQMEQGDADKALAKSVVSATGVASGLVPSTAINRIIELMDMLQNDEIDSTGEAWKVLTGSNNKK